MKKRRVENKGGCPYEYFPSMLGMGVLGKRVPCTGQPLQNGWCELHQSNFDVLQLGEQVHYQRMQVNGALFVGQGRGCWQLLASIVSETNLKWWLDQAKRAVANANREEDAISEAREEDVHQFFLASENPYC